MPPPLPTSPAPRLLARAALAVRVQFFVAGALFATWGVHVPTVKAHYRLGESALALAMLAAGLGAVAALTQAGRLIARWGSRRVALAAGGLCSAGIAALILPTTPAALWALMAAYGVGNGLFDVAINAEATEIERLTGRAQMSGFHGLFSLGGLVGAALGSAWLGAGLAAQWHLAGAAALAFAAVAWASRGMLAPAARPDGPAAGPRTRWQWPHGTLLLIGTLAALGLIAEGAMYDWSVLFLRQERQADAALAAWAYGAFSAAMALGRFAGDAVRARSTPAGLLRACGLLAAAGMALALAVPSPAVSLLGFVLVGLGLANVVPLLFSAAGQVPGVPAATGIATVASLGYLGLMAGPPLIGPIAQARSLTAGLFTVVVFAAILAAAAKRALPAAR